MFVVAAIMCRVLCWILLRGIVFGVLYSFAIIIPRKRVLILLFVFLLLCGNWNCIGQFRGIRTRIFLRVYFDNVTLALNNVTLTSQKPCQYNNKFYAVKQTVTIFQKML